MFDPRTSPINGTSDADVLTSRKDGATVNGLGGDDTLLGQGANDRLDGGTGADEMRGRGGDDTYVVDNAGDTVIESRPGHRHGAKQPRLSPSATISRSWC